MKRAFILLAGLTGLLLLPIAARGARGTYVRKDYGFSLKVGPDWSQTPTQPGEQIEVAKFKDDQKRDFATLSICRFEIGPSGEVTPSAGEDGLPQIPRGWGRPQAANAKEYLLSSFSMMARRMGETMEELPEPRTVKFGKIEGEIYQIELESKRMRGYGQAVLAGIVSNDGEEYLILYSSPPNRFKKLSRYFEYSIRSFRFRGDDTPDEGEDDPDDRGRVVGDEDDLLDPEKRERIKSQLVGTWRYLDTKHYIIVYNCDDRLAHYIAKRVEYMRENAFEVVFPPVEPITECMVIRVCKEMDEYHHYGGPGGSAGYWASGKDELVFPDLAQSSKPDQATIGVMHHEGFHQYIYYALLKHNPPVWFNEGYADFFCVNFKSWGKRLKFDKRHPMRYGTVKSALGQDKLISIRDFIKMSQQQYYAKAQLCYSQGWAFATWLKNITRNERYRDIPRIFFQEMQRGYLEQQGEDGIRGLPPGFGGRMNKVTEHALEKAFEGIDLDQINEDFLKDLKRRM